jgi:glycopeptide antibiotics resistance protein
VIVAVIAAILAVTLIPVTGGGGGTSFACLVCGERGLADGLLNILLFVPLGVALSWRGASTTASLAAALCLSCSIELSQYFIPGRHANLGDVLFNTAGGGVGLLAVHFGARCTRPDPQTAVRLSVGAATTAVAVFSITGLAFEPSFPSTTFFGQWTPNLGNMEWYRGRVLRAELGPIEVPPWQLPSAERFSTLLLSGTPLSIQALAGLPVRALAPLVSVYEIRRREILLIGPDRDDLVLRYRTRAAALRLDQPDYRINRALHGLAPGDTMEIQLRRSGGAFVMSVNDGSAQRMGPTLGSGWALLIYPEALPHWARRSLNPIWIALWFLPLGFYFRLRRRSVLAAVVAFGALMTIPSLTAPLPTPLVEMAGGAAGLIAGVSLSLVTNVADRRSAVL